MILLFLYFMIQSHAYSMHDLNDNEKTWEFSGNYYIYYVRSKAQRDIESNFNAFWELYNCSEGYDAQVLLKM